MIHKIRRLMAALLASTTVAAQAQPPPFVADDGKVGYQELAISADTYYLTFHGSRDTSGPWVDAAWQARASQLCTAKGAEAFVALRYIDEAVLAGDIAMAKWNTMHAWAVKVAGAPIYIPMFIPTGPRNASIDAPGKSGPVRCLAAGAQLHDPSRAVRIADSLDAARKAGVPVQ